MSYQDELRARLDAVERGSKREKESVVDVQRQEEKLFEELSDEFEFGSYDLDEGDVLRTLKILEILDAYPGLFNEKNALKLFYILARVDIVLPKRLLSFSEVPVADFKRIIQSMARHKLLFINDDGELELTLEGKSLASRIGVDIYF